MNISGTLHLYSGDDRELFFVFDDDLAQELYSRAEFKIDEAESRRAFISVARNRFIHRRTLSFSRKQTEIKVSLCSRGTKDGLGSLTTLYDWFVARRGPRPKPFPMLGTLRKVVRDGDRAWELHLTEPGDLVVPPGLVRRTKRAPPERRSYLHRRLFEQRDLGEIGSKAEQLALALARNDYPGPKYSCLWREKFLDSERMEIRRIGVIADIDVWNVTASTPHVFIEVKAQKVPRAGAEPVFHLSAGEWRSHARALKEGFGYQVWLFQYQDIHHFTREPGRVKLVVFESLDPDWLQPDGYIVTPGRAAGEEYTLH